MAAPLALGFIGSGKTSRDNIEAQLNDYTSTYEDVGIVLPVTDDLWSAGIDVVHEWAVANEIPYVAVTTNDPVGKNIAPILDGADEVYKAARVSTKMLQLLAAAGADGDDQALLVFWDDEDEDAGTAVTKALESEIPALDLCNGLEPFTFGEDDEPEEEGEQEPAEASGGKAGVAPDNYDDLGVRALRNLLRERKEEHDIPDRTIGQLAKDDAIRALRNVDNGKGKAAPAAEPEAEGQEDVPARQRAHAAKKAAEATEAVEEVETRTTRARRAFAEGAAEGSGDEAQSLPRSKGSDILDNEDGGGETAVEDEAPFQGEGVLLEVSDGYLRDRALDLAIRGGQQGGDAVASARLYELYLKGEARGPGRPRKDGSPAMPRERDPETGKVIRRKTSS